MEDRALVQKLLLRDSLLWDELVITEGLESRSIKICVRKGLKPKLLTTNGALAL